MHFDQSSWSTRKIREDESRLVDWIRLGTLGSPEITVGVLRDGTWVLDTADGLVAIDNAKAAALWFPILSCTASEFGEQLENLQKVACYLNFQPFPLRHLVVKAISIGGYWAEKALAWLPFVELDDFRRKTVVKDLKSIESNAIYSQRLRHLARKCRIQLEQTLT